MRGHEELALIDEVPVRRGSGHAGACRRGLSSSKAKSSSTSTERIIISGPARCGPSSGEHRTRSLCDPQRRGCAWSSLQAEPKSSSPATGRCRQDRARHGSGLPHSKRRTPNRRTVTESDGHGTVPGAESSLPSAGSAWPRNAAAITWFCSLITGRIKALAPCRKGILADTSDSLAAGRDLLPWRGRGAVCTNGPPRARAAAINATFTLERTVV